ncbi:Myb-like dna-binding protein, partial [Globisporangium splendens]
MTITSHVQSQYFVNDAQIIRLPPSSQQPEKKTKRSGRPWTAEEHNRFLEAMQRFPSGPWKIIASCVGTRTTRQTMTHAQRYREKIARRKRTLAEAHLNGYPVPQTISHGTPATEAEDLDSYGIDDDDLLQAISDTDLMLNFNFEEADNDMDEQLLLSLAESYEPVPFSAEDAQWMVEHLAPASHCNLRQRCTLPIAASRFPFALAPALETEQQLAPPQKMNPSPPAANKSRAPNPKHHYGRLVLTRGPSRSAQSTPRFKIAKLLTVSSQPSLKRKQSHFRLARSPHTPPHSIKTMTISNHIKSQYFVNNAEIIRLEQTQQPEQETKRCGRPWTTEEHNRFLEGLEQFPSGPWKLIAAHVGTRTTRQTMTHAQRYREKIARRKRSLVEAEQLMSDRVAQKASSYMPSADVESSDSDASDGDNLLHAVPGADFMLSLDFEEAGNYRNDQFLMSLVQSYEPLSFSPEDAHWMVEHMVPC